MPQVTRLAAQKRIRNRVNVFLDDEYAFGLQDVIAAELHIGDTLTQEEIRALQRRDATERAYERALNYLSYRPRSTREVARYLRQKEVTEEGVASVLARLERARLIDDRAFARYWVENRQQFRPRGAWALRSELTQKGVSREIAEGALSELDEEGDARRVAARVLRRLVRLDEPVFRRRMLGHLQRRGFGYEVSQRITDQCWRETQDGRAGVWEQRAMPDDE